MTNDYPFRKISNHTLVEMHARAVIDSFGDLFNGQLFTLEQIQKELTHRMCLHDPERHARWCEEHPIYDDDDFE